MTPIGIDFGTSNCTVAGWDGKPYTLPLGLDRPTRWAFPGFEELFPSSFAVANGGRCFGWPAKTTLSDQQPVKRLLTGRETMTVADKVYSSRHVAALLFAALKDRSRSRGVEIDTAVVTVPSNSNGMARYRTREAAGMAGIRVAALINEPTAAAMAYMQLFPGAERLMVYDWGGGTIDVTILEFENGIYQERVSRGIPGLGGIEVDKRLGELMQDQLLTGVEYRGRAALEFRSELERVKIALSFTDADTPVSFVLPDGSEAAITRKMFEQSIEFLIETTLKPVRECLDLAGLEPVDLDAVLMVGGSSYIPRVRERLADFLDTEPVSSHAFNPMTIVSEGAALAAAALSGEADIAFSVISNHALATRVKDQGREALSEVIPRGVPLPYRTSKRYMPNADLKSGLLVQVWEGNADLPIEHEENVKLADLRLVSDAPRRREESEFELEYRYDIDGVVHVTATDVKTGKLLLRDKADFFSENLDIDPEVKDVEATFAATVEESVPKPAIPSRDRSRPVPVHSGPVLVVDGSNLACQGRDVRGGETPSYSQLRRAMVRLGEVYPGARVIVVVDANLRHKLDPADRARLEEDARASRVLETPAGTVGRGDALALQIAKQENAIVVSNDSFREHQDAHPWLRESNRVVGATHLDGAWYFVPRVPPRPSGSRGDGPTNVSVEVPTAVRSTTWSSPAG